MKSWNRRTRVYLTAVLLTLLVVIIPLLCAFYLSWILTIQIERNRLSQITEQVLKRAIVTAQDAYSALYRLNISKELPCSNEHINLLRKVTLSSYAVDEVGYFENAILKCNSWGLINDKVITPFQIDVYTPKGIPVSFHAHSTQAPEKSLIAFQQLPYYILINPLRFADIITDPHVQIALATINGFIVVEINHPDLTLIRSLIKPNTKLIQTDYLFARTESKGIVAIVTERRSVVYSKLMYQQMFLLPIGVLISGLFIALIIYYSNRRLSLPYELVDAIDQNELIVHYQPIIDLKMGTCIGAEALLRWHRQDGKIIPPDIFIPVSEESGITQRLIKFTIEAIIKELGNFLLQNKSCHISINFSAKDLEAAETINMLKEAVIRAGIMPQQFWLEATERELLDNDSSAVIIDKARRAGFVFAIDDFGTGYSNISYLRNFAIDVLKIDKLFVETIGSKAPVSNVIQHIIAMAHSLNLVCVAEGIEDKKQLEYLVNQRVAYGQGWLFSKSLLADDFIKFYEQHPI